MMTVIIAGKQILYYNLLKNSILSFSQVIFKLNYPIGLKK